MKKSAQQTWWALGLSGIALYFWFTQSGKDIAAQIGEDIMKITDSGLALIAGFENFSPVPYPDAEGQSIAYGHFLLPGELGNTIVSPVTQEQGIALLNQDAAIAQAAIDNNVTVPLTKNQHDALLSLVYNIGEHNFANSTLLRWLNAGDYAGAAAQFLVWDKEHKGGVLMVDQSLEDRRASEQQVFLTA
jgi:lysozyme